MDSQGGGYVCFCPVNECLVKVMLLIPWISKLYRFQSHDAFRCVSTIEFKCIYFVPKFASLGHNSFSNN